MRSLSGRSGFPAPPARSACRRPPRAPLLFAAGWSCPAALGPQQSGRAPRRGPNRRLFRRANPPHKLAAPSAHFRCFPSSKSARWPPRPLATRRPLGMRHPLRMRRPLGMPKCRPAAYQHYLPPKPTPAPMPRFVQAIAKAKSCRPIPTRLSSFADAAKMSAP